MKQRFFLVGAVSLSFGFLSIAANAQVVSQQVTINPRVAEDGAPSGDPVTRTLHFNYETMDQSFLTQETVVVGANGQSQTNRSRVNCSYVAARMIRMLIDYDIQETLDDTGHLVPRYEARNNRYHRAVLLRNISDIHVLNGPSTMMGSMATINPLETGRERIPMGRVTITYHPSVVAGRFEYFPKQCGSTAECEFLNQVHWCGLGLLQRNMARHFQAVIDREIVRERESGAQPAGGMARNAGNPIRQAEDFGSTELERRETSQGRLQRFDLGDGQAQVVGASVHRLNGAAPGAANVEPAQSAQGAQE